MTTNPLVSIIIPFRNEEQHIKRCINSLLDSGYPKEKMEFVLVDGGSEDASLRIINQMEVFPAGLKVIDNPKRIVPTGMNLGIAAASGDILLWAGAHTLYFADYIYLSIKLLIEKKAASVGGVIIPKGINRTGRAIAVAARNPFGVGNARYRYANKAGWVDTVFAGCFWKKDILAIGGFNENWVVNQDGELNYRLRKQIGGIYLSPDIRCEYFVRESYCALAKQYFRYGKWRTKTLFQHIGSFTFRQAAAPSFVVFLCACMLYSPVSLAPFFALLLIYSATGILFIYRQQKEPLSINDRLRVLAAFMTMHISWGVGFIVGMMTTFGLRLTNILK